MPLITFFEFQIYKVLYQLFLIITSKEQVALLALDLPPTPARVGVPSGPVVFSRMPNRLSPGFNLALDHIQRLSILGSSALQRIFRDKRPIPALDLDPD